jgi:hypothetical protein
MGFAPIKALFKTDEYVETDNEYLYISNDCLIYPLKKSDIPAGTDLNKAHKSSEYNLQAFISNIPFLDYLLPSIV